jgi:hypothetical protein
MTDEEDLLREIDLIRESIRRDWEDLASKSLTAGQRKAIRDDIQMCIGALKNLRAKLARHSKTKNSDTSRPL